MPTQLESLRKFYFDFHNVYDTNEDEVEMNYSTFRSFIHAQRKIYRNLERFTRINSHPKEEEVLEFSVGVVNASIHVFHDTTSKFSDNSAFNKPIKQKLDD